jgi:hypothetical protein
MGTCAAQLTCLRKVYAHVTVSDHRLSKPEGLNVSFYVFAEFSEKTMMSMFTQHQYQV